MRNQLVFAKLSLLAALALPACGKAVLTHQVVDRPKGTGYQLGTPKNAVFSADVATARDRLRVRAFEQSECDKIRFKLVERFEETLRDGEVVQTQPMGPVQIAEATEPAVPCNDRFAAQAEISLSVGTATYVLGRTDRYGELEAELSSALQHSLYGEQAPPQVELLINRQVVAPLSLAELAKHEQRVGVLVAEFKALLDRQALSPADISRSYVVYEQLRELDRDTPEIRALTERFFELVYQRKAGDAAAQAKLNQDALRRAKELVAVPGATAIPAFVRVALAAGTPSGVVIEWALGQVALTVRSQPAICQSFNWNSSTAGLDVTNRLAFTLARYQYDDAFTTQLRALCSAY